MEVALAERDELARPLHAIPRLLQQEMAQSNGAGLAAAVSAHFAKWAARPDQVPVLTQERAESVAPNSLVRLRGMVVDMLNPEYFLGAYRTSHQGPWQPGALYTDEVPRGLDGAVDTRVLERRPLLVAPVPHEAPWATAAWAGRPVEPETPNLADRPKRTREPSSELPAPALAASASAADAAAAAAAAAARKAARMAEQAGGNSADAQAANDQGQQQQEQGAAEADEHQQEAPAFAPGDCIVQVYGDFDRFKLHDVVEVVGVASVIPALAALHMQQQGGGDGMDVDDFWGERAAALPPTSQVMRLHALSVRKLPPACATAPGRALPPCAQEQLPALRQRALALLSGPLGGDDLAAEYVLLAALGSVVNREDGGAVGLLPLNLTSCPSSSGSHKGAELVPGLAAALRCLLPHVALLPLTLRALNRRRWYPQQCAATGRLFRGCLQLPEGSLLLLDETCLDAGQLGDAGVRNLQALQQVLTQQQLPCGCQVYTHSLHVNQPAVVLSAGRSVLREHLALQLPLQPRRGGWADAGAAGPEAVAAAAAATPELGAVREYLAAARSMQCRMEQAAAEACVGRFRAQQRLDPGFGMDDLHNVITLAKLLSVSLGHEEFSMDSWDRVMGMEQARKQRLAAGAAGAQPQA